MRNDTDDFDGLSLGRADADQDLLADSGAAWKGLFGEVFVDDDNVAPGLIIGVGEGAAGDQGGAHGREVPRKHELKIRGSKFARVGTRIELAPANRTEFPTQGKGFRGGHRLDAGNGLQSLLDLSNKRRALLRFLSSWVAEKLKCQQTVRIIAGIDALELAEAAEHQTRSDKQNEAERYFDHHDHLAQEAAAVETLIAAAAAQSANQV